MDELEDIEGCITELELNGSENMYEVLLFLLHYIEDKGNQDE